MWHCLSKNRLYSKMLRIHLFSIFIIKMPQDLAVLAPLGLLIVKTQTMYSNYYVYLIINEMYIRTCQ